MKCIFFYFLSKLSNIKTTRAFIQIDEINQQIVIKFTGMEMDKKRH
jgi:hypothetical protein